MLIEQGKSSAERVDPWRVSVLIPRVRQTVQGFSLLELMVTVAVVSIILTLGVPSFRTMLTSSRLTTTANDYVSAFTEARMEAIRRNTTTQVCAASGNGTGALATACGTSNAGAVYALDASGNAVLVRAVPEQPAGIAIAGVSALRYTAQGIGRAPGSTTPFAGRLVDINSSYLSADGHRCVYVTTGILFKTCKSSATCDASTEPASC